MSMGFLESTVGLDQKCLQSASPIKIRPFYVVWIFFPRNSAMFLKCEVRFSVINWPERPMHYNMHTNVLSLKCPQSNSSIHRPCHQCVPMINHGQTSDPLSVSSP